MSVVPNALQPFDEHNQKLQSNVHPTDWSNPHPTQPYHLAVIGAGTAGLVTAAAAAGLGARVALIEKELMGGDCLNVGCVPSKAIIAASRTASNAATNAELGIQVDVKAKVDFAQVMNRMRELRASISPVDSAQRFSDLGVDVYFGQASFRNKTSIAVATKSGQPQILQFKKAVIATGARASAAPIKGLDQVPYLTNETIFSLTELPNRFGVIGAGPIGCEMAQAFARLGSDVFLFDISERIMPREDSEASKLVQSQFDLDGVNTILNAKDMEVTTGNQGIQVRINGKPDREIFEVDQLLIAVGRKPNVQDLNLEGVGVNFNNRGINVNDFLQTANSSIFAAGDVCSKFQFTHSADFQARIVVQNALFAVGPFGRKKFSDLIVPWATYTSPEVAHVGMYATQAQSSGIPFDTFIQTFEHLDRAILEGNKDGFVKVITRKGTDQILGATIVAENAGDLISEISLAMTNKIGLSKIGSTIHPYPTIAEAIRKLGDQFNKTKLTPFSSKILKLLLAFNVGK